MKSSISSRARFSFGALSVLPALSSHSIIAGSRTIACASAAKSPPPSVRMVWFCWTMKPGLFTFWTEVAKWPWKKKVRFSTSGCVTEAIRPSHHSTIW